MGIADKRQRDVAVEIAEQILAERQAKVGMVTFAQFEETLEAAFDEFHEGIMSAHNLRKFLKSNGYTSKMARDEIRQQIGIRNFKNASKARDKADQK